jgi:predicted DNA-binding ArsR family transcriptional regulator
MKQKSIKCSDGYKSKKVQEIIKSGWNHLANFYMENGGIPKNGYHTYMKEFKQKFMKTCNTLNKLIKTLRKSKIEKVKTLKNKKS